MSCWNTGPAPQCLNYRFWWQCHYCNCWLCSFYNYVFYFISFMKIYNYNSTFYIEKCMIVDTIQVGSKMFCPSKFSTIHAILFYGPIKSQGSNWRGVTRAVFSLIFFLLKIIFFKIHKHPMCDFWHSSNWITNVFFHSVPYKVFPQKGAWLGLSPLVSCIWPYFGLYPLEKVSFFNLKT